MRNPSRTFLVSILLGAALAGAPSAHALVYAACSTTFTQAPKSCTFTPVGGEIYVSVNGALTGAGVRARVVDPTTNVVVLECYGYYECTAHIGTSTPTDSVGPPVESPLICQVITGSNGNLGCSSRL